MTFGTRLAPCLAWDGWLVAIPAQAEFLCLLAPLLYGEPLHFHTLRLLSPGPFVLSPALYFFLRGQWGSVPGRLLWLPWSRFSAFLRLLSFVTIGRGVDFSLTAFADPPWQWESITKKCSFSVVDPRMAGIPIIVWCTFSSDEGRSPHGGASAENSQIGIRMEG